MLIIENQFTCHTQKKLKLELTSLLFFKWLIGSSFLVNKLPLPCYSIIHALAYVSVLTGIDVAGCTANQVIIDVQNQECGQRDRNDLTAIRSGKGQHFKSLCKCIVCSI